MISMQHKESVAFPQRTWELTWWEKGTVLLENRKVCHSLSRSGRRRKKEIRERGGGKQKSAICMT